MVAYDKPKRGRKPTRLKKKKQTLRARQTQKLSSHHHNTIIKTQKAILEGMNENGFLSEKECRASDVRVLYTRDEWEGYYAWTDFGHEAHCRSNKKSFECNCIRHRGARTKKPTITFRVKEIEDAAAEFVKGVVAHEMAHVIAWVRDGYWAKGNSKGHGAPWKRVCKEIKECLPKDELPRGFEMAKLFHGGQ